MCSDNIEIRTSCIKEKIVKKKTLKDLAKALDVKENFSGTITGFETDSRKIGEGMVFFALKGENVDGHDFLKEVAEKKAIAAVVSKDYRGEDFGIPLLRVDDVLKSLQTLAQAAFKKRKGHTIAVTGSVGKTTTKEFIATLLEGHFTVAKTPGNANSQVGIPLSILNSENTGDVFILEMGMSEKGQISKLVEIAPPDIGVITKIGVSHAEFFHNGIEGIAAAKAEIFSHPKTRCAIINGSSAHFDPFANMIGKDKILFGWEGKDYTLKHALDGIVIEEKGARSPSLSLPFDASHLLDNFCAAVAVARQLGLTWEQIAAQVYKLKPFKMRFEKVEKDGIIFVNDSYNASPESMQAALSNLPMPAIGKKRIAVFGQMKELGQYSVSGHKQVAEFALSRINHLLCYGEGCLPMVEIFNQKKKPVEYFTDFEALRKRLLELATKGDVVLLKGSNSNQLWRLLD